MFKTVLEPHRTNGIVSVSAKNLSGERWAKLINRGNQRRGGEFTTFCLEGSTVSWWSRGGLAGATILQEFQTQARTTD
jgi:hypothetical protein